LTPELKKRIECKYGLPWQKVITTIVWYLTVCKWLLPGDEHPIPRSYNVSVKQSAISIGP
jgi:hypothetical protein